MRPFEELITQALREFERQLKKERLDDVVRRVIEYQRSVRGLGRE